MENDSTPTLLTMGTFTLVNEDEGKYRVIENERQWQLYINRIQISDRGAYMCQINTKTALSEVGYLDVYGRCRENISFFNISSLKIRPETNIIKL